MQLMNVSAPGSLIATSADTACASGYGPGESVRLTVGSTFVTWSVPDADTGPLTWSFAVNVSV